MRNTTRATNGHQTAASGALWRLWGRNAATGESASGRMTNAAHWGRRSVHCGSVYGYGYTGSTRCTSGTSSRRTRSTPLASVNCDIGHPRHAPWSATFTTPSSLTSTSSTSPPSACSAGLILSSAAWTRSFTGDSFHGTAGQCRHSRLIDPADPRHRATAYRAILAEVVPSPTADIRQSHMSPRTGRAVGCVQRRPTLPRTTPQYHRRWRA